MGISNKSWTTMGNFISWTTKVGISMSWTKTVGINKNSYTPEYHERMKWAILSLTNISLTTKVVRTSTVASRGYYFSNCCRFDFPALHLFSSFMAQQCPLQRPLDPRLSLTTRCEAYVFLSPWKRRGFKWPLVPVHHIDRCHPLRTKSITNGWRYKGRTGW